MGDHGQVRREVAQQGNDGEAAVSYCHDAPPRQPMGDLINACLPQSVICLCRLPSAAA
jgi:hypothetical protein